MNRYQRRVEARARRRQINDGLQGAAGQQGRGRGAQRHARSLARRHPARRGRGGKGRLHRKAFSYSIEQGAKMVKGVRATKQIVQVGMQRRSSEAVRGAKNLLEDGALGEIVLARAQWFWNLKPMPQKLSLEGKLDWERFQGPANKRYALDERRFFHWRNFSEYNGGHMTDQGTHLMDVIQWFCNQGNRPHQPSARARSTYTKAPMFPTRSAPSSSIRRSSPLGRSVTATRTKTVGRFSCRARRPRWSLTTTATASTRSRGAVRDPAQTDPRI